MIWGAKDEFRPKDWRLKRALFYLDIGIRPNRVDDKYVHMAYNYFKRHATLDALVASGNPAREHRYRERLKYNFPDLYLAHYIWRTNEQFLRNAIEGMLLATDEFEDMAYSACVATSVVEVYESVFFDLRTRRDRKLFIMQETMSSALQFGMNHNDTDVQWKAYALHNGKAFLVAAMSRGSIMTPELAAQAERIVDSDMTRNALIGATTRPVDKYHVAEAMQEYLQNKQIKLTVMGGGDGQGALNELLGKILVSMASGMQIRGSSVSALEGRAALPIKQLADGVIFGNQDQKVLPSTRAKETV